MGYLLSTVLVSLSIFLVGLAHRLNVVGSQFGADVFFGDVWGDAF